MFYCTIIKRTLNIKILLIRLRYNT